jgi:hypothetical protein
VHCPRRSTSLQELFLEAQPEGDSLTFRGQGLTAAERTTSMQRQIAAFLTSHAAATATLAPETWHAHQCLTRFSITNGELLPLQSNPVVFQAALLTTSLVGIHLYTTDQAVFPFVRNLSQLPHLTHLHITTEDPGDDPGLFFLQPILAVPHLPRLRSLELEVRDEDEGMGDIQIQIPGRWSQMTELTRVRFAGYPLRLAALTPLAAVRQLVLDNMVAMGGLSCLYPLTALTCLVGPDRMIEAQGEQQGAAGAQGALAAAPPAQWVQHLQSLMWRDVSGTGAALPLHAPCASPVHSAELSTPEVMLAAPGAAYRSNRKNLPNVFVETAQVVTSAHDTRTPSSQVFQQGRGGTIPHPPVSSINQSLRAARLIHACPRWVCTASPAQSIDVDRAHTGASTPAGQLTASRAVVAAGASCLPLLPQLTSLTHLGLVGACVNPSLCRWAPSRGRWPGAACHSLLPL